MDYMKSIQNFAPSNDQEVTDQKVILSYIQDYPDNVLLRDNKIGHITSSGFLMNKDLNRILLVHHNIRGVWGWTGGHADGDDDLLHVAIKEAKEETGIVTVKPLTHSIVSLDILPVFSHWRKGQFVNTHLHLSVAYILICDEREQVRPRLAENSDVAWFDTEFVNEANFKSADVYLYNKLIEKARDISVPIVLF